MAKKRGLGKGLGALIGSNSEAAQRRGHSVLDVQAALDETTLTGEPILLEDGAYLISLDPRDVKPNPKQPRTHFDESALEELAESIRRDGVQEPVIVREVNGEYQLVSGERRVRASVLADVETVPAVVRTVSDNDMLRLGLIENIQREDLNAVETARAYQQLVDEFGWKQERLAEEVGKKRATVANMLRLLHLPPVVQDAIASGDLSMGHARALLALGSVDAQIVGARKIISEGLSVRQAEALSGTKAKPKPKRKAEKADPNLAELEDDLRRHLGTRVHVKAQSPERGRIEIEYMSLDEFDRILAVLKGHR